MTKHASRIHLTLLIDDQGAGLYLESGELLARLPESNPGTALETLWIPILRDLASPGSEVAILLDHPATLVQCQEVPFLSAREQRDVAARVFAGEPAAADLECVAALDPDAFADGEYVLWLAAQPRQNLNAWVAAIQGAGWVPSYILPFDRALLQGLDGLWQASQDSILLAAIPGATGHLCCFHGRALVLRRSFTLPEDPEEAEELIHEEVSRLLQFIKQKNRALVFPSLQVIGLPALSRALVSRLQGALRLEPVYLAPELWPVLLKGLARERSRKDGLNLVPREVLEAGRLRVFKATVWGASIIMGLLMAAATAFLFSQELLLKRDLGQSSRRLADREARSAEEQRTVQARLPLLRVALAEQRQGRAVLALARLSTAIFSAPKGIQLEKVEILQIPGGPIAHRFTVTGLAFTETSFSVGPLARYLAVLGSQSGVTLEPVTEASTSDRVEEGAVPRLDQMAITRFTLRGTAQ